MENILIKIMIGMGFVLMIEISYALPHLLVALSMINLIVKNLTSRCAVHR